MISLSKLIPSPRGLFVFEAVVRTGSFTAAAGEFNVTQPSVSRAIAQLEAGLGIRLFDRDPGGPRLTEDGRDLHAAVVAGLGGIAEAIGAIQERQRTRRPQVTFSLSSSFVTMWLVPRLGAFNEAFPDVDLRFELLPGAMREVPETVDMATRVVTDDDTRFHRWAFAPEIVVPVCSPSYLRDHGPVDPKGDGAGHAFLHLTDHDMAQWSGVLDWTGGRDRTQGMWRDFSDYSVILQAALNGRGVALGWLSVVSSALLEGTLVPASSRRIVTGRHHRLVAPRTRPLRPVVVDIAAWLAAHMAGDLRRLAPLLDMDETLLS